MFENVVLVPGFGHLSKFEHFLKILSFTIDFVEWVEMPVGLPQEEIGGECFAPLNIIKYNYVSIFPMVCLCFVRAGMILIHF